MTPKTPSYGNLTIQNLGPRLFPSPSLKRGYSAEGPAWHSDGDRILLNDHISVVQHAIQYHKPLKSIELAGPRRSAEVGGLRRARARENLLDRRDDRIVRCDMPRLLFLGDPWPAPQESLKMISFFATLYPMIRRM